MIKEQWLRFTVFYDIIVVQLADLPAWLKFCLWTQRPGHFSFPVANIFLK